MICRVGLYRETEFPTHVQHRRIFLKHLARYLLQSFGLRVFDNKLHQSPAEPPSLEIGSEQDRVFTGLVDRIGVNPNYTNQLMSGFVDRHKGHRAGVVGRPGFAAERERLEQRRLDRDLCLWRCVVWDGVLVSGAGVG